MSIDHGELNLPLHKRGNIDAELDRYKEQQSLLAKQQAAIHAAARQQAAECRSEANRLIAELSDERVAELGQRQGIPARSVRKRLREMAARHPEIALAALKKEAA